jgi:nucleoside-diphosphate-sugar epimerase
MNSAVVITGGTGFLGSHLALRFLERFPELAVVCVARPSGHWSARDRVLLALSKAAKDSGISGMPIRYAERLIVMEDRFLSRDPVREPVPVVGIDGVKLDSFWHCAASVKFMESATNEVWRANVTGLQNALSLADALGIRTFNHVSTAYASGTMSGRIPETIDLRPRGFNNVYEESKHYGEQLLHHYCDARGIEYRIFRPSIIIGHSQTFRTSSRAGFYYGLDALRQLHDRTVEKDRRYFDRHSLRVRFDRNATLNLIPIDFVVSEMIDLHLTGNETLNQVFHITSESPISFCDWLQKITPLLGINRIEMAADDDELCPLGALFTKQLRAYVPYVTQRKVFDRTNVSRYGVDRDQMGYLLDVDRLTSFARCYLADAGPPAADRVA